MRDAVGAMCADLAFRAVHWPRAVVHATIALSLPMPRVLGYPCKTNTVSKHRRSRLLRAARPLIINRSGALSMSRRSNWADRSMTYGPVNYYGTTDRNGRPYSAVVKDNIIVELNGRLRSEIRISRDIVAGDWTTQRVHKTLKKGSCPEPGEVRCLFNTPKLNQAWARTFNVYTGWQCAT